MVSEKWPWMPFHARYSRDSAYLVWMAAIYLLHLIADLLMGGTGPAGEAGECDEKEEQKKKDPFYGILAGALLLFAACAAHLAPYDPYEQNLELSRFFRRPRRTGWGRTAMEEICFKDSPARGSAFFQHFWSLRQAL